MRIYKKKLALSALVGHFRWFPGGGGGAKTSQSGGGIARTLSSGLMNLTQYYCYHSGLSYNRILDVFL